MFRNESVFTNENKKHNNNAYIYIILFIVNNNLYYFIIFNIIIIESEFLEITLLLNLLCINLLCKFYKLHGTEFFIKLKFFLNIYTISITNSNKRNVSH